jgi:ABC-type sugar transport system, periplasmic component
MVGSVSRAGENRDYGLSFPTLANIFFATLQEAVEVKAKELNVNIVSLEASNEVARQISIVEDMIIQNKAGLLLVPIETEAVVPAVEKLNAANIPVVTVDRRISPEFGVKVLAHVGADNVIGGENAAKFIVDRIIKQKGEAKGTVIELYGFVGSGPAIDRSEGFQKIMKQYPNITIKTQTANFFRDDGMRVMEDFITSTPEIDAVFGANDEMVMGAIEAMQASGKFDFSKVTTVGFDAIDDALQSIRDGVLTGTIEQFPGKQASMGFEVLYDFVSKGKKPASDLVLIEPQVVHKGNIETLYK